MDNASNIFGKRKYRIMIVEDSPNTIKQYKAEINGQFDVDFFEDARTALAYYENSKYDLVITDLMLPLKSGEALIFDIKYANPMQKIAVISGIPDYLRLKAYDNIQVFEKPVRICDIITYVLEGRVLHPIEGGMTQRRKHPRFLVDIEGVLLTSEKQEKLLIHVKNVSLGGLFIQGGIPQMLKNEPVLPILLPLLDQPLIVNAKKCWEKTDFGAGLQFQNLGHSEYSVLELFLESLKAKNEY